MLAVCCAAFSAKAVAQNHECATTVVGDLEVVPFESKVFSNTRNLRILLPRGYHLAMYGTRHYPVLYLNDGQNLFDLCTSMFNHEEWQVDETVAALTAAGDIPPMIVVGIDNAGRRGRAHEYLPYPDETLSPP